MDSQMDDILILTFIKPNGKGEIKPTFKIPTMALQDELAKLREDRIKKAFKIDKKYEKIDSKDYMRKADYLREIEGLANETTIKTLQVIIDRDKMSKEDLKLFDAPYTDEFWRQQDLHLIKKAVASFRSLFEG